MRPLSSWTGIRKGQTASGTKPPAEPCCYSSGVNRKWIDPPAQDIQTPTYHPYNLLRLPRTLDYIFLSGMHSGERGGLHKLSM